VGLPNESWKGTKISWETVGSWLPPAEAVDEAFRESITRKIQKGIEGKYEVSSVCWFIRVC